LNVLSVSTARFPDEQTPRTSETGVGVEAAKRCPYDVNGEGGKVEMNEAGLPVPLAEQTLRIRRMTK
jgi:hypothetical protein